MHVQRCNLCGNETFHTLGRGYDRTILTNRAIYTLLQCRECGLVTLTPRPTTDEELAAIYPASYESYMQRPQSLLMLMRRMAWRAEIGEILALTTPASRILELGSATGEFLNELRRRGRPHLIGVEISGVAAQLARDRYDLDVRTGQLADVDLPPGSVDLIVMRHVLEHVADPLALLKYIEYILRPGGYCIVTIPNLDSHTARIFKSHWYGYDVPRHLSLFPSTTLALLFRLVSLRICSIMHISTPNFWIGSTRFWLQALGFGKLARFVRYQNPFAILFFLPFGLISAVMKSSGVIRIIAQRPR
ncbi:class I SAM-dependent methyltransferase [Candidatus Chloroploca sp. M-50]|uniref:Class I SAM-dependent methyltransferase n=1 Tax=Candidatus Chloroploca mongolica TaxID=2528176 RepID=A0ABS4DE43_9CHLR|nr:class I SAM-dependent methyltransferase [Candidatus Chloroploca mongolica]